MATFQPTATPMRQIPGAFFNTPAPTRNNPVARRLNFGDPATSSSAGRNSISGSLGVASVPEPSPAPASTEPPLPPVLKAARSVNQVLQQDESYPDLDSYCRRKSRMHCSPCRL